MSTKQSVLILASWQNNNSNWFETQICCDDK